MGEHELGIFEPPCLHQHGGRFGFRDLLRGNRAAFRLCECRRDCRKKAATSKEAIVVARSARIMDFGADRPWSQVHNGTQSRPAAIGYGGCVYNPTTLSPSAFPPPAVIQDLRRAVHDTDRDAPFVRERP